MADAVNPRRDSLFDRAAALVGPRHLDLHLRSVPHLISFPLRAFYDRPVEVATRRPGVDGLDAIDVVRPPRPGRAAEVAAIVDLLAARLGAMEGGAGGGAATIGVITPFRAHARALEAALAHAFDEASLRALRLRVGTVHEVQGAELDETVLAIGLAAGDPAQRVAFVEDPHLFDVMVPRARRRTTVVTALDPGSTTLLGRYLAHAAGPEPVPPDRSVDDPWAAALAAHLRAVGVPVHLGYAVGPWLLDLVVDDPSRAVAVEARLHPAGATAHLDRHRALVGLGWEVLDARPGVLGDDPAVAALAVAAAVGPAPGGAG
ncbi:MAG: AAA domain-containing protein [Acidimicrobiales bacterium]